MKTIMAFLIILFSGCSESQESKNYENFKKIKLEMDYNEVINIMGSPMNSAQLNNDTLRFSIAYSSVSGSSDDYYIFFSKRDSIVVAIGDGQ